MKSLVVISLLLLLSFGAPAVLAHDDDASESMEMMESDDHMDSMGMEDDEMMMEPSEVNSFEMFWPMVAGRTRGDKVYFLKRIKERVRGAIIFGQAQKADYSLFLATKRILEAEKLLSENKTSLANQTLDESLESLQKLESISQQSIDFGDLVHSMNQRMDNLILLSKLLNEKYPDSGDKLNQIIETLQKATDNI